MMFQVAERAGDYIVEAYVIEDVNSLCGHWFPLRNFGFRQGDAFAFRDWDCPNLTPSQVKTLAQRYDPAVKYSRLSGTKFVKHL